MNPFASLPKVTGFMSMLLILVAIWFGAPLFEIRGVAPFASVGARLLLIVIVLLAIGLVVLVEWLIKKQKQTPEEQAEKDTLRRVKLLHKGQIKQALRKISSIFPLWQKNSRHFLFRLPWYLVIGDTNSGKTSLLQNAGIDFLNSFIMPAQTIKSPTSGNGYNWLFSKQAVFLEVSPKNTVVTEGNEEEQLPDNYLSIKDPVWIAIVKFLRRFRPFKPINGILLTISLPDLLLHNEAYATAKRQAVDLALQLIHSQFKCQVPVYLLFTQCDQIAGFQEYFSDLTKDEQEQPWGIYFPQQKFNSLTEQQAFFENSFNQFIKQLNNRLLTRLEAERNAESRRIASYFPQQLELFKPIINDFLPDVNHAYLRGIYFTSVKQLGQSHDFVMSALTAKFNIAMPAPMPQMAQEKLYFAKELIPSAILPESKWDWQSNYNQRFTFAKYRVGYIASTAILVFCTASLVSSYTRNKENVLLLQDYVADYNQTLSELPVKSKSLTAILPLLEVAKKFNDVYPSTSKQWLLDFELYEPFKIQNAAQDAFQRVLNTILLPRIALRLEQILQEQPNDNELLYFALKGYLAFSGNEMTKSNWIAPPILLDLAKSNKVEPEQQAAIEQYLLLASQNTNEHFKVDQALIHKTRSRLQTFPLAEFAYYELRQVAEDRLPQLNIEKEVGSSFSHVFTYKGMHHSIPALYTHQGYKELYGDKGLELIKQGADLYWILGLKKSESTARLATQHMTPALWARYSDDYVYFWRRFLESIHIVPISNMQALIELIEETTSSHSPLKRMLDLIYENTAAIDGKKLTISQQFIKLNAVTDPRIKQSPIQYNKVVKQLNAVKGYFNNLAKAPNFNQAAFDAAKAYMQGADSPIRQLKELAAQTPDPLGRWLDEIANNSLGVLLSAAHQVITHAWQTDVLPTYENDLKGRFPFERNTEAVVSMASFGEFFGTDGIMDKFLKAYVLPFVNVNSHPWQAYQFGEYSIGITPAIISKLEKAEAMRKVYFASSGKTPHVQFAIQPRYLDNRASNVTLQYGNQVMGYRHGPQQVSTWLWPLSTETQQASITINDFNGKAYSKTYEGQWAWLKLLESGSFKAANGPGHYIWTINNGEHKASFELWTAKSLPIFDLGVFNSLHLPNQL